MMRHVAFHAGVEREVVAVEVLLGNEAQYTFEVRAVGHAGVLERTQILIVEDMQVSVGHDLTQRALATVGFGVLLAGQPAEEIGGTVVERVRDEVVADARFAGCRVCGTVAIESKRHEDVAVLAS